MTIRLTDEQLEELERHWRDMPDDPLSTFYALSDPERILALIEEVKSWRQLEKK